MFLLEPVSLYLMLLPAHIAAVFVVGQGPLQIREKVMHFWWFLLLQMFALFEANCISFCIAYQTARSVSL